MGMFYLGAIIAFVITLALWWGVSTFALQKEFNAAEVAVSVATVLIAVVIASILTKKLVKKESISVKVAKN